MVLSSKFDEYMKQALSLANEAFAAGEVPVGAIVTDENGTVIGRGRNRREETSFISAHAEIEAINMACKARKSWKLDGCFLFVTLEPCPMCAGAIIEARISTLVYGTKDQAMGCCSSVIDLFSENLGHRPKVYAGIREDECRGILKKFFKELR